MFELIKTLIFGFHNECLALNKAREQNKAAGIKDLPKNILPKHIPGECFLYTITDSKPIRCVGGWAWKDGEVHLEGENGFSYLWPNAQILEKMRKERPQAFTRG